MPFIQSLFCLQGADNRARFYSIILVNALTFLLLNLLVGSLFFSLVLLIITTVISALSTRRRLKDAQLKKAWLILSSGSYFFSGLFIVFVESNYSNWLILIPLFISALLLTYPSQKKLNYILGYAGPIDLSSYEKSNNSNLHQRIEPTLLGDNNLAIETELSQRKTTSSQIIKQPVTQQIISDTTNDIGELLRKKLLQHSKIITIAIGLLFTIIILLVFIDTKESTPIAIEAKQTKNSSNATKSTTKLARLSPLAMPDNFTLYLTQYNGVILHWQATENELKQLWSQATAKGEESCKTITFNNKEQYRTLEVIVEDQQNHFASFSPLDTANLLKAMALRGSFTLCGFKFSLKGSQAILGKHSHYADFIDYGN